MKVLWAGNHDNFRASFETHPGLKCYGDMWRLSSGAPISQSSWILKQLAFAICFLSLITSWLPNALKPCWMSGLFWQTIRPLGLLVSSLPLRQNLSQQFSWLGRRGAQDRKIAVPLDGRESRDEATGRNKATARWKIKVWNGWSQIKIGI